MWYNDLDKIDRLVKFIDYDKASKMDIKITPVGKVTDIKKFIDIHHSIVKSNFNNPRYQPYKKRLINVLMQIYNVRKL